MTFTLEEVEIEKKSCKEGLRYPFEELSRERVE